MIYNLPKDDLKVYTKKYILEKLKISKSHFYNILNNKALIETHKLKRKKEENDLIKIKNLISSCEYPLGSRMIYAKLKTDEKICRHKIQKILKINNLNCSVRKTNLSKQDMVKNFADKIKPNLLERKFRIARPFMHLVTDVTYLQYNNNDRAYLCAIKDAVTGRILSHEISKKNNLHMAIKCITKLKEFPISHCAILHSDQGSIYLSDEYNLKTSEMKISTSMSKRGNCWDNASIESFFGHFKDECKYNTSSTFKELEFCINNYITYFNNDRIQWDRNKLTPIKYEKYLLSLNKENFNLYLVNEEIKYGKMKERAKEKAIASAKNLGI